MPADERHELATTRYRAEDAVRAAKLGDYDRTRRMLLAALKALPSKSLTPADPDGKVEA